MYPLINTRLGTLIFFVVDRLTPAAGLIARGALSAIGRWPGWSQVEYELRPPAGSGAQQR